MQFLKTPNSWLYHITKIYASKYNVDKIKRQNYNSLHYIFDTTENSHNNMNMETTTKVCTTLFY